MLDSIIFCWKLNMEGINLRFINYYVYLYLLFGIDLVNSMPLTLKIINDLNFIQTLLSFILKFKIFLKK